MSWLLTVYILLLAAGTLINVPLYGKQVQVADFFFIFILASVTWDLKRGRNIEFSKIPLLIRFFLMALLLLLLASSGFSGHITKSLVEFAAITYLVFLFLWVVYLPLDQQHLKTVLHFWLYLSGGLCVLALGGFIASSVSGHGNWFVQIYPEMKSLIPFARVKATFPTMNMFASFLHVGIIFLLAFVISERWRKHYILLAAFFLSCLALTASRNLLGVFITIFLAVLPVKGRLSLSVSKYLAFCLCLLLFFLVLMTTLWSVFPTKMNHDRQNHSLTLSFNTASSLYTILNRMSLRFIKQNPLAGVGPGLFNQKMVEQLDWYEVKATYKAKGITDRNVSIDPHNTYLGWAAEAGLPFVIIMLGLFLGLFRLMWKGYKAWPDSFTGGFCYVCLCGMAGFLVNGLYIDILTMRHFWLMMGLGTLGSVLCLRSQTPGVKAR